MDFSWNSTHAALWHVRQQMLKPVAEADLDTPVLERLPGIGHPKSASFCHDARSAQRAAGSFERSRAVS